MPEKAYIILFIYLFFKKIMGTTEHVRVGAHEFTILNINSLNISYKLNNYNL